MSGRTAYIVTRSSRFQRESQALVGSHRRVEDMIAGLVTVLQSVPDHHPLVEGTDIRVAVVQVGRPHLRVYYRIDGDRPRRAGQRRPRELTSWRGQEGSGW